VATIGQFPPFRVFAKPYPKTQSTAIPIPRGAELGWTTGFDIASNLTRKPPLTVNYYDLEWIAA
jgi:hypothetical protein